jgi:hypothetical protein
LISSSSSSSYYFIIIIIIDDDDGEGGIVWIWDGQFMRITTLPTLISWAVEAIY